MFLGIGICFLFSCFYLFVAFAKVCRQEQVSCLFERAEETTQIHQALEIKTPTSCQVWRLSKNSLISMQDSYFVTKKELNKEIVK